jgi:RNA polymerase sigma-70 factor (ECF subfamily)
MLGSLEDARDAAQESFVKAYHALPLYKPELSFRNWVLRIASNLCVDLLRRRTSATSSEALSETGWEPKDPSLAVDETVLQKLDARDVELAIAELPESYRLPLVLKHCEDLSVKEISDLLGLPDGTVKIRLFRAREILRKRLTERGFSLSR